MPEIWFDVKYRLSCGGAGDVECIHIAILHLITSLPHFSLHHSTSNTISDIIPHHIPRHTISHHISLAPLAAHYSLCNTIFQNLTISATCITPRLALHPISHYVPHNATFQITPSIGHIIAPPHLTSHFAQPHFTCSTS